MGLSSIPSGDPFFFLPVSRFEPEKMFERQVLKFLSVKNSCVNERARAFSFVNLPVPASPLNMTLKKLLIMTVTTFDAADGLCVLVFCVFFWIFKYLQS